MAQPPEEERGWLYLCVIEAWVARIIRISWLANGPAQKNGAEGRMQEAKAGQAAT
ncbi:hypothetical protein [Mameliella sp.]|uniref:hypothetical protein n=1 Tax=Mameliella sp. TaxID=1924940 RepID=UPI003B514057